MRIISSNPAVNFTTNAIALSGTPVDNYADQSLMFGNNSAALAVAGKNASGFALLAGVTVGGTGDYAALTMPGANVPDWILNAGQGLGTAGWTILALARIPVHSGGHGVFTNQNALGNAYGILDYANGAITTADAHGGQTHPTGFSYAQWQVMGFDVGPDGTISVYRGSNGALALDSSYNPGAVVVAPLGGTQQVLLGQTAPAGWELDIALLNTYVGSNRPTLAYLQTQYKRLSLYFNGRLSNNI